jgi:hypothetical protein
MLPLLLLELMQRTTDTVRMLFTFRTACKRQQEALLLLQHCCC